MGCLCHVSHMVKPRKTFIQHPFEGLTGTRQAHHHVRLSSTIRSDIRWLHTFMAEWNEVNMIPHPRTPVTKAWTDASGTFGCGAVCPIWWKQLQWTQSLKAMRLGEGNSISWIELLPIVLASVVWSLAWRDQRIMVHCDNTGAVTVANFGYSRAPQIMHLLQCLFFITARFEFSLQAVHIEGTDNTLANAVSHNNHIFLDSQVFQSTYQHISFLEELVFLLVVEQAEWTSDRWTQ